MTTRLYTSISQQTTLTAALSSSATTMIVNNASALLGGSITPAVGQTFTVVIDPDTSLEEIVDIIYPSSPSSTTLTIQRGRDNTVAVAHSAGAGVRHMGIGRDFTEANQHIENTTTAHGLTLADVVLTTGTNNVSSGMIQTGAVGTLKIDDTAVTAAKLAPNAVTTAKIADSNVTTAKIADANVTTAKIADSAITSAKIADGAIATADIADGAITSAKIADLGIATGDIADLAITTGKIADSAITSAKIADLTIATGDIADGAITSAKIADLTIATGDLADGAVTSAKIADGTITNSDISATAGIAYSKLSLNGSITSADLVDGTIVATDIANGTITAAKMAVDPYARANHTGTQTASTISDFDTQVRTSRLDQMAAPTASVSLNSQKVTNLATPTTNTDAATKLYVDTKVADLVNSAPATLDTLGEIATAISAGGSVVSTLVAKSGDTMTGPLILNADPSANLGAATKQYVDAVAGSATAAAASAAAAATTYDNFDDRYLGAKASAPTLDNDGNALLTGALYWNTTINAMYVWNGSAWGTISSISDIYRYRFNAAGGETSVSGLDANGLTLSYLVGKEQVYLNGVLLTRTSDYTASDGTSITSLAALTAGDVLEVITYTPFEIADAIARATVDAKGDILVGTANDTVSKISVGTNGQYLKADSTTATGLVWGTAVAPADYTAKGVILVGTGAGTYVAQTVGSNGQVLTANSAQADGVEWTTINALPSQTGNAGRYLTTDGTTASWATVTTDPTADIFMMMGA